YTACSICIQKLAILKHPVSLFSTRTQISGRSGSVFSNVYGNGLTLAVAFSSLAKYLTIKSSEFAPANASSSISCKLNLVEVVGSSIPASQLVRCSTIRHGFTTSTNSTTTYHDSLVSLKLFSSRSYTVELLIKKS